MYLSVPSGPILDSGVGGIQVVASEHGRGDLMDSRSGSKYVMNFSDLLSQQVPPVRDELP